MEIERKRKKVVHSTGFPYATSPWPLIADTDQQLILDLLCDFLSPLGLHRQNCVNRSKGKRSKRRRRKKDKEAAGNITPSLAPVPELVHDITIGFNSTMKVLQQLAQLTTPLVPVPDIGARLTSVKEVAAVFVCTSTLPALLTSSIPLLVAAASAHSPPTSSIRLVSLPREAENRLAHVLFQPQVGFVLLLHDASGAKTLIDTVIDKTPPVNIPWLSPNTQAEYLPVKIETASSARNTSATNGLQNS